MLLPTLQQLSRRYPNDAFIGMNSLRTSIQWSRLIDDLENEYS